MQTDGRVNDYVKRVVSLWLIALTEARMKLEEIRGRGCLIFMKEQSPCLALRLPYPFLSVHWEGNTLNGLKMAAKT